MNEEYEEPERRGDEELPPPQLKPLPDGLRYEFLDDTNRYPIIVSTEISEEERASETHDDIKEASQSFWLFNERSKRDKSHDSHAPYLLGRRS